jgi:hypothetical protein
LKRTPGGITPAFFIIHPANDYLQYFFEDAFFDVEEREVGEERVIQEELFRIVSVVWIFAPKGCI